MTSNELTKVIKNWRRSHHDLRFGQDLHNRIYLKLQDLNDGQPPSDKNIVEYLFYIEDKELAKLWYDPPRKEW